MPSPNEYTVVEEPFFRRLRDRHGWTYLRGDEWDPAVTGRTSFGEVLLPDRLRAAIGRLNPWLDLNQVEEAALRLDRLQAGGLLEANEEAHGLLTVGTTVAMPNAERSRTVSYIDFADPAANDFLVVNQFRVDSPGGGYIKPDLVLFVNGIPLVVVEAKSPGIAKDPIHEAITQLLRYSNNRGSATPEGAERLFYYNLVSVATSFDHARLGAVGARYKYYQEWKDPYPLTIADLTAQLGKAPSAQELLIAGVLDPARLLDILANFTLFTTVGGQRIKIIPRYQQFRAVQKAIERLAAPRDATPPGLPDERGGIVWHTQGSGKSFTMAYLVRKMRTTPAVRDYKVVIVTDRRDLQKQLAETAALVGDALQVARRVAQLRSLLATPGAGLVFGMIQKFRSRHEENVAAAHLEANLNTSERILLLVDEGHRSQAGAFHATLLAALPHCARIAFTGTPILRADKKQTATIFGSFIDTYTIAQSQEDGATLPILYEGRTAQGVVSGGESINTLFDNLFKDHTEEERELIRKKYGTYSDVAEAPKLIAAKARDMLRHYVAQILPGGFKAQVVAVSRLAAVRYQSAFMDARRALVAALEEQGALLEGFDPDDESLDAEMRELVRAYPYLDQLRRLEFAAIISPDDHNEETTFAKWTDASTQTSQIERFKKPLAQDPFAFLIVNAMLLTGFDAPVEQVLYLDRGMRDHDLLQAIARVNRPAEGKSYGLVVDYYGVAKNLTTALEQYTAADVTSALTDWRDQLPELQQAHRLVVALFTDAGLALDDTEACALHLADERRRAEFTVLMQAFTAALDAVLPRPEGLAYLADLKRLGFIGRRAANLYRDNTLDLGEAEKKVRALIDRYITAEAVNLKVAPLGILSPEFDLYIQSLPASRSRAAEMEHATRHYISTHEQEDPVHYEKLRQRLEQILADHREQWDAQVAALAEFLQRIREGADQAIPGLDTQVEVPFYRLLAERQASPPDETRRAELIAITRALVEQIRQRVRRVDFWRMGNAQNELRGDLMKQLIDRSVVAPPQFRPVTDDLMRLARVLHSRLV